MRISPAAFRRSRPAARRPRTGGFLKKRMTTSYVDSRKRVAGLDSDFEVDLGESLHQQLFVHGRGRYLYWVNAALGTLNWALLPGGRVHWRTVGRLDQLQL